MEPCSHVGTISSSILQIVTPSPFSHQLSISSWLGIGIWAFSLLSMLEFLTAFILFWSCVDNPSFCGSSLVMSRGLHSFPSYDSCTLPMPLPLYPEPCESLGCFNIDALSKAKYTNLLILSTLKMMSLH